MTIYDLFNMGWTVHPVSLYDEEGVEGWRWEDVEGNERSTVTGDWQERPPLPDLTEDELNHATKGATE